MKLSHEGLRTRISKLAAAAQRLKRVSDVKVPFCLAFMTDQERVPNPLQIVRSLPRGAAVILRDYNMSARAGFAAQLKSVCASRGILLFVGADASLADWIGADGVHMPSWFDGKGGIPPGLLRIAACHNAEELTRAKERNADLVLLSPAYPSESHPGDKGLGIDAFHALAAASPAPVLAAGGINETNARMLAAPNVAGLAAIGAFTA